MAQKPPPFWIRDDLIKDDGDRNKCKILFEMLDESCRCCMDEKLSRGNTQALYQTLTCQNNNCLQYATFLLNEFYYHGPGFLKIMQEHFLGKNDFSDSIVQVYQYTNNFAIDFISQEEYYEADSTHSSRNAFQKEPYNIIEVPWNPVRFHQWLVPALIVSYGMEHDILEFLTWPMPKKYLSIANDFVFLAKTLKERLTFGIALLGTMVNQSPEIDPSICAMILDDVVLPALPALEFFAGEGVPLLRSFKRLVWPKNGNSERLMEPISRKYSMEIPSALESLFSNNIFHYSFWLNLADRQLIMGKVDNYAEISSLLKNQSKEPGVVEVRAYSAAEDKLKPSCDPVFSNVDLKSSLYRLFFETGVLFSPGLSNQEALQLLRPVCGNRILCREIIDVVKLTNIAYKNHNRLYDMRIPEVTLHFSYKLEERQKFLSLALKLCNFTDGKLRLSAMTVAGPDISVMVIENSLKQCKKRQLQRSDLLCAILNSRPAKFDTARTKFWEPFNALEKRVQDLLSEIFSESFSWMDQKLGPFPEWQFVQHYLPSLAASFAEKVKHKPGGYHLSEEKVLMLLEGLVSHCETQFKLYKENPQPFNLFRLPPHNTNFELACLFTAQNQERHLELNLLLNWLFLGEYNANIYNISQLVFLADFDWLKSKEMAPEVLKKREHHLNLLRANLEKKPQFDPLLEVAALSARECLERMDLLLKVARSCFQLPPEAGDEIPKLQKLSNLHQALGIISEIRTIFKSKRLMTAKFQEPKGVCISYAKIRFFHLWNQKLNNTPESKEDLFEVHQRFVGLQAASKKYKNMKLEQVFSEMCSSLVEARLKEKIFSVPPTYNSPGSKSAKKAIKRFIAGDTAEFQKIMDRFLA